MALLQAHHCKPRKQQITAGVNYNLVNEKFMCSLCTVELPETEFCEHLEGHLTLKPYVCKYCDRDFPTRDCVSEHLRSFHQQDEQIIVLKLSDRTKGIIEEARNVGNVFYKPVKMLVPMSNCVAVVISKTPAHNLTTVPGPKQKTIKAPMGSYSHISSLESTSTVRSILPVANSLVSLGSHPYPASQLNYNTVLTSARPQLQAEQSRYSVAFTTQPPTGSVPATSTNVLQTQASSCLSQNACTPVTSLRLQFPQKLSVQVPGTQVASTLIYNLVNNVSTSTIAATETQNSWNQAAPEKSHDSVTVTPFLAVETAAVTHIERPSPERIENSYDSFRITSLSASKAAVTSSITQTEGLLPERIAANPRTRAERQSTESIGMGDDDDISLRCFYGCGICVISFPTAVELKVHVERVHTLEQNLPCAHCGFRCRSSNHLIQHMEDHLASDNRKTFSCSLLENSDKVAQFENNDMKFIIRMLKTSLVANSDIDAVYHFACNMCQSEFADLDQLGLHLQESLLEVIECKHCASLFMDKISWQKHMALEHVDMSRMYCIKRKLLCYERKMHSNVLQQASQEDIPCLSNVERDAETSDYQCEGTHHESHGTSEAAANVLDAIKTIASNVINKPEVHSKDVELTETHSDHEGRDVADGIEAETTHEDISKIPNLLDLVKTSAAMRSLISAVSLNAGRVEQGSVAITEPNRNERRGNNVAQQCESGMYTTTADERRGSVDVDLHGLMKPVSSHGNNELREIAPDLTAAASVSGNDRLLQIGNSGNMEDVQPVSKTSTSVDSSNSVKSALSHAKDNLTNTILDSILQYFNTEDLGHQEVVTEIQLGVQSSSHDSFDQIVSENISTLPNNMTVLLNNPCLNEKGELSVVGQAEAVSEISKPRVKHASHSVVANIDASLDLDQATSVESQDGCDVTSVSSSDTVSCKLPQASDCSVGSKDYCNITPTVLSLPATRVSDFASTSAANFNLSMAETRTILCVSEQNKLEYTENTCLPVEIGADIDNRQESRHSSVVLENNLRSGVQHDIQHVISNVAKVGGDQAASPALTGISETKINDLLKEPYTNNGSHWTPDVISMLKTVSHDSGDIANPVSDSLGPNHDSCHDIDFSSSKDPTCTLQESVSDFAGNDESLENDTSCGHDLLHLNIDKTNSKLTQDIQTEKQETNDGLYDKVHNKNSHASTEDGQLYASNETSACIESGETCEENVLNSPSHSDNFMEENNNTASVEQTSFASNITENNDSSHTETNGLSDKVSTEQDLSNSHFSCNSGTLISCFPDGDHNVHPKDKSLKTSFTGKCAKCRLVTQEKSHKNSEVDPPEISTIKNNYSEPTIFEARGTRLDHFATETPTTLEREMVSEKLRKCRRPDTKNNRNILDSHCKRKPDDEPDKANITSKILRKNSEKRNNSEDTVKRLERFVAVIQSPIDIQGADTTAEVCRVTSKSSNKMARKRKNEVYKCMKCNFTCIWDPEEMNKHINSEHPYYRCEYCAATFITLKMVHGHLKFVHPGKGPSVMDSPIAVEQLFTRADNSYNGQGADCIDMTSQTPAKRKKRSQSSLRDGAKKRTPKSSSNIRLIQAKVHTHLNSCDVNLTSDQQRQPLHASENKKTSVGVNPNRSTAARGLKTTQCKLAAYSKSESILEKNVREISPVPENEVSSTKKSIFTSKKAAISYNGDPRSAKTERHLFKTTKSINIQQLDHAASLNSQASRSKVTSTITEERDREVDKPTSDNTMSCTFVKTFDRTHRLLPSVSLHTKKTVALGATFLLSPRSAENNTRGNKVTEYQELDQKSFVQNMRSKMRLLGPVSSQNNVRKENSFPATSNHIDINFSLNSATSVQFSSTVTKQELNPVDISHIAETSNRHDNVQVHETFPDRLCSETASTCMSDAMSLNHTTITASANVIPKKQDSKRCGTWMASQLETETAAEGDENQDFVPRDLRSAHSGNNLIMQHGSKTESKFENAPTSDMTPDKTSFFLHNYPLKCEECSRILKCVTDIEKHYNRVHPRQDVRLIERKSGFLFSNSGECLRREFNGKPSEDSYLCRYCAFRSMTRFAVETHIRRVHPKREVRVFSLCNPKTGGHRTKSEVTSKVTALPQEASRNNDSTPSSYFCNVCNDIKNSEFQFRLHLASHPCYKNTTQHISERRFKCFMCEHDSHRRINIRAHIKRVHNKTVDDDVGIIVNDQQRNVDSWHGLVNIKPRVVLINPLKQHPAYLQRLVLAHGIKTLDFIVCRSPDIPKSKQYGRYFAIE